MLAPWPMPCHITRRLAAFALMIVAAVAATPSEPTIGAFCTPSNTTSTLTSLGGAGGRGRRGGRDGRPVHALDQVECGDGAELRIELAPGDHEFADPVRGRAID